MKKTTMIGLDVGGGGMRRNMKTKDAEGGMRRTNHHAAVARRMRVSASAANRFLREIGKTIN